ncbi:MAG: hypothetical protein PHC86_04420 [Eubacteriales bacterium]|nr:hypothetical protein [Eubacteriales bacterium]
MNWQVILNTLPQLTLEETEIFAPPREMEAAIASYNRALVNLRSDSADVAQIALRKLVINYPLFGPASLLFGVCLIEQHRYAAAQEVVDRAKLAGLSASENRLAEALVATINEQRITTSTETPATHKSKFGMKPSSESSSRRETNLSSGTPILSRSGKSNKPRMASKKEVSHVMRRGDLAERETTPILQISQRVDIPRLTKIAGFVLAAIVLVGLVGWGISKITWPMFSPSTPAIKAPSTAEKLNFILDRLGQLSSKDSEIALLLADYDQFIAPEGLPPTGSSGLQNSESPTSTTTASMQSADPTEITETTEAISQNDLLTQVYSEYQAALILASSDVVTAAESLLTIQKAAEGLETEQTSPAVPLSVTALKSKIDGSLDMYRTDASEILRVQGRDAYDIKDYETSLTLYLRAYALKPLAYGGGVAYYCGRNYQALGQFEKAQPFYQFVIENFAGSEVADYAAVRLQELG